MLAAVIEGPGALRVRDLPEPALGDHTVRCQLLFGAVCSGTDRHLVQGHAPFCWWFAAPAVLGHESIGRVVEVGPRVRHLAVGDLVTRVGTTPVGGVGVAWGGFAEQGIATDWRAMQEDGLPAEQWQGQRVHQRLPAGTDPAAATMVITWRETLSYLRRAGAAAGRRLLVVGSGGNGLAFAAHARHLGMPCAVIGSPSRAAEVQRTGAELVDYRDADAVGALRRHLAGERFDLIVDAVGRVGGVDRILPLLRPGGTLGIYGLDDGDRFAMNPLAAGASLTVYNGGYDEAEVHDEVVALMQAGRLDATVMLTNHADPFPLADIGAAIEAAGSRRCVKPLVRIAR